MVEGPDGRWTSNRIKKTDLVVFLLALRAAIATFVMRLSPPPSSAICSGGTVGRHHLTRKKRGDARTPKAKEEAHLRV